MLMRIHACWYIKFLRGVNPPSSQIKPSWTASHFSNYHVSFDNTRLRSPQLLLPHTHWHAINTTLTIRFPALLNPVFFFFDWHYNPLWVLALSVILFHSALSLRCFLHRLIPIICISSSISTIHLFLGLPLILVPVGFHSNSLYLCPH
jgi:hypothetical protein